MSLADRFPTYAVVGASTGLSLIAVSKVYCYMTKGSTPTPNSVEAELNAVYQTTDKNMTGTFIAGAVAGMLGFAVLFDPNSPFKGTFTDLTVGSPFL